MALTKRGKVWYYDFIKDGKRHQGSTGLTNKNKAREVESKLRADLAMSRFGISSQKRSPLVRDFFAPDGQFLQHIDQHAKKPRTKIFYRENSKPLVAWTGWRDLPLTEIAGWIDKYSAHRLKTVSDWTVNNELRTLRRGVKLAEKWKLCSVMQVPLLPEPKGREFVVGAELEREYLEVTGYPLKYVAIFIVDLGLRPDELVMLRKSDVDAGFESVIVQDGKTPKARRAQPMTDRIREAIQVLTALFPSSEWLFPSGVGSRHYLAKSLSNSHNKLRKKMGWPQEFDIYCFRHTFGTQLAESGANNFEIMRLMGHSDIRTSSKYIHPTAEGLTRAMKRKEALAKLTRGEIQAIDSLQNSLQQSVNDGKD
jgi:integrase